MGTGLSKVIIFIFSKIKILHHYFVIIRQSIKETPCWIEIQIHRALQLLDDLFNSMSHQMTNTVVTASSNPPMMVNNNSNNLSTSSIKMEPTRPSYTNMDS
jgi:hypothetical protein